MPTNNSNSASRRLISLLLYSPSNSQLWRDDSSFGIRQNTTAEFFIASTGIRTALDSLIVENIGDEGSFKEKTELLVKKKIIDSEDKELLDVLINAGSASAHRGFRPNRLTMKNMMEVAEKIFYNICIAPKERAEVLKKAKKLSNKIPQRTKSKSKTKSQPQT